MSSKRQAGMTLIELIIAIVIISVGLAGVLTVFTITVRSSADPMINKQMSAIAEGMMEEILLKPFVAAANAAPANGCARDTFNDIQDYNSYATANVCDIDGQALAALAGYAVRVTVAQPAASPFPDVPAADVRLITVNIMHGADVYWLTGWRTNYAGSP